MSVWAATGSPMAIPAAMVTGVLIDADHALDFYYFYVKKNRRRLFVFLHAWEYSIVGLTLALLVWHHPILIAGVLGHLGHLAGDHIYNKPYRPLAYSIVFRMYYGFDRAQVFREPPATFSEALHNSIPLWGAIEPMLPRLASRFRNRAP